MKKIYYFLLNEKSGATAVEYALIAAGIALAIVAAVALAGGNLSTFFDDVGGQI
jgi:pilus assembly protein Flp/PilA